MSTGALALPPPTLRMKVSGGKSAREGSMAVHVWRALVPTRFLRTFTRWAALLDFPMVAILDPATAHWLRTVVGVCYVVFASGVARKTSTANKVMEPRLKERSNTMVRVARFMFASGFTVATRATEWRSLAEGMNERW